MTTIGPDAANIFNKFSLSEAESKNLSVIKTKFDAYFAMITNITCKRYLFNKITQAEGQPFNDSLTSVVNQGKKCEFGELYDSLLRDKIVVGVCSDTVRENLIAEEGLTFDKTVKICRASEITKLQVSAMRGDTLPGMHAMHISHKKILSESQDTELKTRSKCPKCGYNHPQRMCPAVGKECKKCGKVAKTAFQYWVKQMSFGLASAPEVFQQIMCHTLHGIKGAEYSMDDFLLHAESINELDVITETVMKKLAEAGLTLHCSKTAKIPGNDKLLVKFIPRVAECSAPLRKLLEKDLAVHWELEQENAFEDLKDSLKSLLLLRYLDQIKPLTISVDASSHSVASVLLQENHPVFYASKALTKTQQNHSQIEKEAFAILSTYKKFHEYIWGNQEVTIETDHKPLKAIFKKSLHDSPARLHRIQIEILPYNPTTFRDEQAVYEDIIFKGKRTLTPPSWKPLILSQLHCSHKGVQGTLAIARDQVFWSGMTQDITSFVQNCATCQKIQNDPSQESLSEETVPSSPWMCGLLSMGYPMSFVQMEGHSIHHTSSRSSERNRTSSIEYRVHTFLGRTVSWSDTYKKQKNLLAKCEEDQLDIWVALLHLRNTSTGNLGFLVQRLMGRRTKTTLPSSAKLLQLALIKGVRQNLTTCRQTEIDRVNRNRHKPAPLQATQEVLLLERHKQWIPAEVVQAAPDSRSYIIDSPRGRYRRDSWFFKPLKWERPQPAQYKDPRQGATILPPKIPPEGSLPETSEPLQSTSAEPGNQGEEENGNNSRSTSPDFRGFSHDPEHRSTPRNTYEHQMANVPKKTRGGSNVIPPHKLNL
ncbi:hypothetical protein PR048_031934 [Dryococelus australis]|uniref:RNA-directed DNA polymerase n=1 Tax=Dryococelus australis TaxID=614101 RepID=A0ABQ9G6P5_9NEOP|nr:hypothetical protein PR048_031934 [Dryococelus australis]